MIKLLLLFLLSFVIYNADAQSVLPSVINLKEAEKIDKAIPPVSLKKIGNKESMEEDFITPNVPLPPGAILRPQPDSLKTVQNFTGNTTVASPSPRKTFQGLVDNASFIPPDVHGCVGLNHIVVTHNTELRITDKTGFELSKIAITAFWAGVTPGGAGDPHINFDHYTNRWIMTAQSDLNATSSLLVAVSQTSDPTGNWNRYAFRIDPTGLNGFDYPLVGYNQNWLVIGGNNFSNSSGAFNNVQIFIFDMTTLNNGSAITLGTNAQLINVGSAQGATYSPVTTYETGAASNTMYILQTWNSTSRALRLSTLSGVIPSVNFNATPPTFPIGNIAWGGNSGITNNNSSPQLTETRRINSGDHRLCNSVLVNGKLWTAHHVFFGTGNVSTVRAAIQWWQIATNGTVLQNALIDDGVPEVHRTYPSIAVNSAEEVLIGYTKSMTTRFPSAAYSFRKSSTPANTMQDEVVYKDGIASYYKDYSSGNGRNRWGDYSFTSLDPVSSTFWTLQEYSEARAGAGTADNDSRWASYWAEVAPVNAPNEVFFRNSGIVISETGNTGTCPLYKDIIVPIDISGTATNNATLTFSASGTAVQGQNYSIITPTVNYLNGDNTVKNVTIRIFDNAVVEGNKTLNLTYNISGSGVVAASTSQVTSITIIDNDVVPQAVFQNTAVAGGLTTTLSSSTPFRASQGTQSKFQSLYLASALQPLGLQAGTLSKYALFFNGTANVTYNNVSVKLLNSGITNINTANFVTGSFTTIFSGSITSPATSGWMDIPLSGSFVWDGTSNIVVEICFDNPGTTTDLTVLGTAPGGNNPSIFTRVSTGSGCTLTAAVSSSTFRPDIRVQIDAPGNVAETVLNSSKTVSFGPSQTIYVYNSNGKVLAKVENLSTVDYGCTQFIIDRQGTSSVPFWNNNTANYLFSKSLKVIPTNNPSNGSYSISLYYNAAEVSGWQTATGQTLSSASMVKVSNGRYIPDVTPATPYVADITLVPITVTSHNTNDVIVSGTFNNTSFSGFGIGVPSAPLPVTSLTFSGAEINKSAVLNWQTITEYNNQGFELQKSFDGISFSKIAYVEGAINSNTPSNYLYSDPAKLGTVQYYRLKQLDIDGKFTYSGIVAIRKNTIVDFSIISVSNPFSNDIRITFSEPTQAKAVFELYDASGKMVLTTQGQVYGPNITIPVEQNLAKGTYILRVLINDMVFNEKLIKK